MHVYVILAEEHQTIFSIFNHHQQVCRALVFQIPVVHKHVGRCLQLIFDAPDADLFDIDITFLLQLEE
jgi:hypothetical protein